MSVVEVLFTQGPMSPPIQTEVRLQLLPLPPYTVFSVAGDAESVLGYCASMLLQGEITFPSLIHPDDQDVWDEMLGSQSPSAAKPQPQPQVRNLRVRQANGRIRCLVVQHDQELAEAGPVVNLWLRDAKSLFDPADALAAHPGFRSMMDNTNDFIFFKNRHHVLTSASQTLASLTRPSAHWTDLIGQTDYDIFPEAYADIYYRLEKQVYAGVSIALEIQQYETPRGLKGWVDNRKYPIKNAQGEITGLFGIAREITDQVRAEQALRHERDSTRNILETVETMIVALDTGGRITLVNRKGCQLLGYTEDELIGQDWITTCLPRNGDADQVRDVLAKALAGQLEGVEYFENPVRTRNGEERLIAWHNSTICDKDGNIIGALSAGEDITERRETENALRQEKEFSEDSLNAMPGVFYMFDMSGRFVRWNQQFSKVTGYSDAELATMRGTDFFGGDDQRLVGEAMQAVFTQGHADVEADIQTKDGRQLRHYFRGQRCTIGDQVYLLGVGLDITERKQAEEKLQLAAGVFTHALEGIVITDAQGRIVDVNDAFTRIAGYSREEVLGQNPRMFKSGRQDTAFYASMWGALIHEGHWSGEVWNRHKTGKVFAEMLTISAVRDAAGTTQHYVALFSDITASKEHQSRLEHIAHFDALTGLPNRVLLADRLQQAMAQAQRRQQQLAVVYLDLDGFKAINDRYDHQMGDQVLITLAQRMKVALRECDTMARIGGDEFVAVLIDLQDTSACVPLLGRLLAVAAEPVPVGELALQVSASLGVTFYPQAQDIDADQLLRQADHAMYQAKVAGKNRYHVFDAAQDSSLRSHHESLERIRLALENREFVLHYQPKVNMHTGQVVGAEALIRWQHPDKGLLAPATFLPVIEDHPLAVDVGEWVMDAALTQIEAWHTAGLDLPVSVNIGARQLQQVNFVERLQAILARHPQANPRSLELEVLETSALADIGQVSQVIEDCARMGVRFALDDFGTGYSSLTYLKRLRVALLKIDQSFVRDMLDDPDDLAILQGVIGLAAAFNREVIAEGVETIAHGTALLELGCQLAQGYGVARPMPAEQMAAWVATWRPDAAWCAAP